MRYRLRTLLIFLAIAPLLLSIAYFQLQRNLAWRHRREGPLIRRAKFEGNRQFSNKKLLKIIAINEGIRLNAYSADQSLRKLQAFYAQQGYPQTKITLLAGHHQGDKSLAFEITEGPQKSP